MKQLMMAVVTAFACVAFGEGKLLKALPFEDPKEIQTWPGDCTVELDDEEKTQGKTSIVFTPDNNFCAYFWQKLTPGKTYTASFMVKADKAPIPRITFAVNFKNSNGKPAGAFSKPIRDLVPCDDKWHPATVSFAAPAGACRGQVMLAMFRSNATIFIDDFKLYEGGAGDVPAVKATAASPAASGKGEMLIRVKFDGEAPAVTGVEVVK